MIISWVRNNYGYIIYIFVILMGMIISSKEVHQNTVWDLIYSCFYGFSAKGMSLTTLLYFWIIFFGVIYIQSILMNQELSDYFYYSLIRYFKVKYWFFIRISRIFYINFIFIICLLLLCFIFGYCLGLKWERVIYLYPNLSVLQMLYHIIVNGWLQLVIYYLILFIVYWLTNKTVIRFCAFVGLLIFSMPSLNGMWLPSGLNAVGYLTGLWFDTFRITEILLFWMCFLLAITYFLLKRRNNLV